MYAWMDACMYVSMYYVVRVFMMSRYHDVHVYTTYETCMYTYTYTHIILIAQMSLSCYLFLPHFHSVSLSLSLTLSLSLYIYIYLHWYICRCLYIYIYTHIHIYMYVFLFIHIYIWMYFSLSLSPSLYIKLCGIQVLNDCLDLLLGIVGFQVTCGRFLHRAHDWCYNNAPRSPLLTQQNSK